MLLDLHIHTSRYSRSCSVLNPRQIGPIVRAAGLDGFCITEHDVAWSEVELDSLAAEEEAGCGLLILTGREVVCQEGHVLIFGLAKRPPVNLPAAELAGIVRGAGGATILAHPLRFGFGLSQDESRLVELWRLFDAVEVWTPSHRPEENEAAFALAARHGLPAVAGSDAHTTEELGRWAARIDRPLAGLTDLIASLRQGRCQPWRLAGQGE